MQPAEAQKRFWPVDLLLGSCERREQNYRSEVSLGGLARIARLSESRFARAFKASTGTPPYAWLLQQRVRRTQELLAGTEKALSEIVVQVGFAN